MIGGGQFYTQGKGCDPRVGRVVDRLELNAKETVVSMSLSNPSRVYSPVKVALVSAASKFDSLPSEHSVSTLRSLVAGDDGVRGCQQI